MLENNNEALLTLFKRLYGESNEKAQFALTNDAKYFTHAFLQLLLYNKEQTCSVELTDANPCLNDGATACPLIAASLNKIMLQGDKKNPIDRTPIKPETLYFYHCHIEAGKYRGGNTGSIFNIFHLSRYNAQYNKARLTLVGLNNINDTDLPQDVKDFVGENHAAIKSQEKLSIIISFIKNSNSAEEIHDLLTKISTEESSLGLAVKGIMEKKEFQEKYDEAKGGILTEIKNFIIKCFLAIYEFAKWWFTVDLINESKENWRENCSATEDKAHDFTEYTVNRLQEQKLLLPQ